MTTSNQNENKSKAKTIDRVRIAIEEEILSGALRSHQRLIEEEIAERLGLSRTPIREAFKQLEVKGLVTRLPTRGLIVTPLTPEDIRNTFEVRESLETLAIKLACERATDQHLNRATEWLVNYNKSVDERIQRGSGLRIPGEPDWNALFHMELNSASGNKKLVYYIQDVRDVQRLAYVSRFFGPTEFNLFKIQHEDILEGVRQRNEDRAERAVREHLNTLCELFLKYL